MPSPSVTHCSVLSRLGALAASALHRGALLCLTLTLVVLSARAPATADVAQREEWRATIAKTGSSQAQWAGVWDAVLATADPAAEVVAVLGPIIKLPGLPAIESQSQENRERRLAWCLGRVLAYGEGDLLLVDEMTMRLAGDPHLTETLKREYIKEDNATREQPGWQRLRDHAEACLRRKNVTPREALPCLQILGFHARGRAADTLAILRDTGRQWLNSKKEYNAIRKAYRVTIERLLRRRRFYDFKAAFTWLDTSPQSGILKSRGAGWRSPVVRRDRYDDLLAEAALLESPDAERVRKLSERLIAKITEPAELLQFLDPSKTPEARLRRGAISHARSIGPDGAKPNWIALVTTVLAAEEDTSVISGLLDILNTPSFKQAGPHAPAVVAAILARLRDKYRVDDPKHRARMVQTLTALGTRADIETALRDSGNRFYEDGVEGQLQIYVGLLEHYGEVEGAQPAVIVEHYFAEGPNPAPEALRRVGAEAFGKAAIRDSKDPATRALAGAILRFLLRGRGTAGLPPELEGSGLDPDTVGETAEAVRRAVVSSLRHYPEDATLDLLLQVASSAKPTEATEAVRTLGYVLERRADRSAAALDRLTPLLGADPIPGDQVLVAVLAAFSSLPADAEVALRAKITTALTALLNPQGEPKRTDPVARAAAEAAVALRMDDAALLRNLLLRRLSAEPEAVEPWRVLLRTHFEALAEADGTPHDAAIFRFLQSNKSGAEGTTREQANLAEELAAGMAAKSVRSKTSYWHATQLFARARAALQQPDQQRADLAAAIVAYREAISRKTSGEEASILSAWQGYYGACMLLAPLEEDEQRLNRWLEAAEAAARSGNGDLQKTANAEAISRLAEDGAGLNDEQRRRLAVVRDLLKTGAN